MSMFKDMTKHIRTLENSIGALENIVTDLSFKVDSSPASGTLGNDKCRIPSILSVSVTLIFLLSCSGYCGFMLQN